jgi:hypothetical protein
MGGKVACHSYHPSWPQVAEYITRALGIALGEAVGLVKLAWT